MNTLEDYQLSWLFQVTQMSFIPCTLEEAIDHFRQKFGMREADAREVFHLLESEGALHITRRHDPDDDPMPDDIMSMTREAKDLSFVENVMNSAENGQAKDVNFHFWRLQDDQIEIALDNLVRAGHAKYIKQIVRGLITQIDNHDN